MLEKDRVVLATLHKRPKTCEAGPMKKSVRRDQRLTRSLRIRFRRNKRGVRRKTVSSSPLRAPQRLA